MTVCHHMLLGCRTQKKHESGKDSEHEQDTHQCPTYGEPDLVDSTKSNNSEKHEIATGCFAHGGGGTTLDTPTLCDISGAILHPLNAANLGTPNSHVSEHLDCNHDKPVLPKIHQDPYKHS